MEQPKPSQITEEQEVTTNTLDQSNEVDNTDQEPVVIPFVIDKDTVSRFNPSRFGL